MKIAEMLQWEFDEEMKKTRTMLGIVPEGHGEFKPHEKSMMLAKLAGHLATLPAYATRALTSPDVDVFENRMKPVVFESREQVLADYDRLVEEARAALKGASDEHLGEIWTASFKGNKVFSGTRYNAYRMMGIDHMIHHRAHLQVYLRLLDVPLPMIYGPTADATMFG